MELRQLGNTGRSLSLVGLGGVTLVDMEQKNADSLVATAVDNGVNYFDVAPSYGRNCETELRLGTALKPYRDQSFLACKTGRRDGAGAEEEMNRSLKHLQTDHFDLYQLHAITSIQEVDECFQSGGAMETITKAKESGKILNIGFSAHSVEAAFHAMELFDFASALFPINFVTFYEGNFGPQIISRCLERGVGRLALKSMARTQWMEKSAHPYPHCWYEPLSDVHISDLALRFTLSQPITAAIPPGDPGLFSLAVKIAQNFHPISQEEIMELKAYAKGLTPIFHAA